MFRRRLSESRCTLFSKQLSADALARKTSFITFQPWTSSEVAINYIYIATTDVSETGISQGVILYVVTGVAVTIGASWMVQRGMS